MSLKWDNSDQAARFSGEFLDHYLQLGFGVLSKREVDLLIFHLLRKHHADFRDAGGYELANRLGISDTRVRNLRRDAGLRFGVQISRTEALRTVASRLFEFGKTKALRKDGDLLFQLEDPVLQREIEQAACDLGYFTDTSFSRSLLRIPVHVFVQIMLPVFEDADEQVARILAAEEDKAERADEQAVREQGLSARIEYWLGKHERKRGVAEKVLELFVNLVSGSPA